MSFTNKVILITGASTGIGAHLAVHLAKKGGHIALVGRNEDRLKKVSDEIKNVDGPNALIIVADVTRDAERIIQSTVDHFGSLDVLVNNAAEMSRDTAENIELSNFDCTINTNVRSIVHLIKLSVVHLEKTKGNILNVSSIAGLRTKVNCYGHSISKAAVNQLTKNAALDLASKGIRVNAVNPGAIRTPHFDTGYDFTGEEIEEYANSYKTRYPLQRIGECADTSAAIEFLIGDTASFITGVIFPVDGGALLVGE